jgi:hypothetical protein
MPFLIVNQYDLAHAAGEGIYVGRAFAFVTEKALTSPSLGWVASILGGVLPSAVIVPLPPGASTALPGVMVSGPSLPPLTLAAVTSDKSVYREGKDVVHLCAVHAPSAGRKATLLVRCQGDVYARHQVALDARGLAHVVLRDLPVGDYEASWDGAPAEAPACTFTVATYRLAPLVARLTSRTMRGATLDFSLALSSFGASVDGEISLELHDNGRRIDRARVQAVDGVASGSFDLKGDGPHVIVVAVAADPSKTATVPIIGSRAAERSETPFSKLGTEWYGSLLPTEGARDIRGIFLREDPVASTAPVKLESVVGAVVRITARAKLGRACVVVYDPTFPTKRPGAVDVQTAQHPAHADPSYGQAEARFREGRFAEARAEFLAARDKLSTPHPNYAYYLACCDARVGRHAEAIGWLREAVVDGWTDFAHLTSDEDLASLRDEPSFRSIATQGRIVVMRENLAEGETIEAPTLGPLTLVTIGVIELPIIWEGWAAVVTPSGAELAVEAPARIEPGTTLRVGLRSRCPSASVYVIVKDARLPSADTPTARLAGEMKRYVAAADKELQSTFLIESLDKDPRLSPPVPRAYAMPLSASPAYARGMGAAPPPTRAMAMPMLAMAAPAPPGAASPMQDFERLRAPAPRGGAGPYRETSPRMTLQIADDEPELLYAGIVTCTGGTARLEVPLGNAVADYVVEAFAIDGLDWTSAEARVAATKDTFASIQLPAFVQAGDVAVAQLHFGTQTGRARVRVLRDGAEMPLAYGGTAVTGELSAPRGSVTFLAEAGDYEAIVDDGAGKIERVWGRVDVPGKIRRRVKTVVLLQPGEQVSKRSDPSIVGLRLLPGLAKPFTALVSATADYGHACCEQTAAKMMSACAMFALSNEDEAQRTKAASIIIAGVRRERSMYLEGAGFKMYPESSATADAYWGPKAARYLHYLAPLRELSPPPSLATAIADGLKMAADAARAYGVNMPPREPVSPEDSYAMAYFGDSRAAEHAVSAALERAKRSRTPMTSPGAVGMRADLAYDAASLLRGGGPKHMSDALKMTNAVVAALGEEGRLYSTVDSVAAVALMTELSRGVASGDGSVEADTRTGRTQEIAAAGTELETVRAIQGVAAVEVSREVEEDWSTLRGDVTMRVWLEKNGRPVRDVATLDAVDLRVQLTGGYKAGDLAWVCLPDALSRIVGGGQIKRFSVDFKGQNDLTVPLAVTGITVDRTGQPGRQRFAVAVRNMFEEERGTASGPLEVAVTAAAEASGPISRALAALRSILR